MGNNCFLFMRTLVTACLLWGAVVIAVWSADIVVTGVAVHSVAGATLADITLNNGLELREVRVLSIGGRQALRFPEYVSRSKKVFPQVVLRTRQAREAATAAVTERRSAASAPRLNFAVEKFQPYRKRSALKVFATVVFNDAVEVECKVLEGKNGPWVAWPARKEQDSRRWVDQVSFPDKKLKEAVEQDLLTKYATSVAESGGETQ